MGENSKIEWTNSTFNPWVGCQKISPACEHCYAESWSKRTGQAGLWRGERRRTSAANWKLPLKWNKEAEAAGTRPRVFCSSLADVFEDHEAILYKWRDELFSLIRDTPNLDWLLLTKRPENIADIMLANGSQFGFYGMDWNFETHFPNVWLGTTAENQEYADKRIPELLAVPAKVHFLSCEPLLSSLDISQYLFPAVSTDIRKVFPVKGLNWCIAGGESGPNARPSHPDWFRSLRDQCQAAGVAFHFKQWGEYSPFVSSLADGKGEDLYNTRIWGMADGLVFRGNYLHDWNKNVVRVGKKNAGRLLDGRTWDELPVAL